MPYGGNYYMFCEAVFITSYAGKLSHASWGNYCMHWDSYHMFCRGSYYMSCKVVITCLFGKLSMLYEVIMMFCEAVFIISCEEVVTFFVGQLVHALGHLSHAL